MDGLVKKQDRKKSPSTDVSSEFVKLFVVGRKGELQWLIAG